MTKLANLPYLALAMVVAGSIAANAAAAGDYWPSGASSDVITNNDCGYITEVYGDARIKRAYVLDDLAGAPAYVADRVHTGDYLTVPGDGRLEWVCGNNTIVVLGSDTSVRLLGLRAFPGGDGVQRMRLDIEILQGEARAQVRLNADKPESVMFSLGDVEALLERGDVRCGATGDARVVVIAGAASARIRRGETPGAPFVLEELKMLGMEAPVTAARGAIDDIARRLPFSFELERAALPPLPALGYDLEAP